jgi:integrase
LLAISGKGWPAWSDDALTRADRGLFGSVRLGFYLALYTGQRKGDVLRMRWDDITDGVLHIAAQEKTGKELFIPVHQILAAELARVHAELVAKMAEGRIVEINPDEGTIITKLDGDQYTKGGFKRTWEKQRDRFDLGGCHWHGLRRNSVNFLLEADCSIAQTSAITGQSFEMVQHYAKQVNQRKLAEQAMNKLSTSGGKPKWQTSGPSRN